MARIQEYDTRSRFAATVEETRRLTAPESADEVRHLVLAVETGGFAVEVGQSVGVLVPGPHETGQEEHLRLYSVAAIDDGAGGKPRLEICVKRCSYIDDFSGERQPGVASNYLCDRRRGDRVTLTGPYGLPFEVPEDRSADLLMIGLGTGIAPFRAFVRHIYERIGAWEGRVRLFYGARSGLELLYMNDEQNDFARYYDEETFRAFEGLSPRPHMDDPVALDEKLRDQGDEIRSMLEKPDTRVYVAGLERMLEPLDRALCAIAGSEDRWRRRKAELVAGGRWTELVY